MALDAQRGIVQSPEPAAALELLLLNLALLPQLLPVGQTTPGPGGPNGGQTTGQTGGQPPSMGTAAQAQTVAAASPRGGSAGVPSEAAQGVQARPRDAASTQHAANDADDGDSDEPDAAPDTGDSSADPSSAPRNDAPTSAPATPTHRPCGNWRGHHRAHCP